MKKIGIIDQPQETAEWINKVVQKTLVTNVKRGSLDVSEV